MVSKVYTLDPKEVRFDDKYVVFNPTHNELEYAATRQSIEKLGQLDPVLMLDGMCVDGRHRVRACKDLGLTVRAVDIDTTTPEANILMLCNKNVMSGRDYDNAQKAIQALKLVNEYEIAVQEAAKMMKIDRRLVSYAATIKGYGKDELLDKLLDNKSNKVQLPNMNTPSRSLELIAKYVKAEAEEKTLVVNDSERIQWKPDALIKTEHGKAWYYEQLQLIELLGISVLGPLMVELANLKFSAEPQHD